MTKRCKNCNHPLEGNFCSNCGQSSQTERINMRYLVHDFLHGVLHVDKGLFYTIKELLIRPGQMLRSYIKGKRVQHFRPLGFLFLMATIYAFLTIFLDISISYENSWMSDGSNEIAENSQIINKWVVEHYGIANLLLLPITALATFLVFRKEHFNYGEHLIINTYITGIVIFALILSLPILFLFKEQSIAIHLQLILSMLVYIYMYMSVFTSYSLWSRFLRVILFSIVIMFFLLLIGTITGVLVIIYS